MLTNERMICQGLYTFFWLSGPLHLVTADPECQHLCVLDFLKWAVIDRPSTTAHTASCPHSPHHPALLVSTWFFPALPAQWVAATFACCHYDSQMASDTTHSIMGRQMAHSLKFVMIHLAGHLLRTLTFYSGSGFWKPVILVALPFRIVSSTSFSTLLFKWTKALV